MEILSDNLTKKDFGFHNLPSHQDALDNILPKRTIIPNEINAMTRKETNRMLERMLITRNLPEEKKEEILIKPHLTTREKTLKIEIIAEKIDKSGYIPDDIILPTVKQIHKHINTVDLDKSTQLNIRKAEQHGHINSILRRSIDQNIMTKQVDFDPEFPDISVSSTADTVQVFKEHVKIINDSKSVAGQKRVNLEIGRAHV